MKPSFTHVYVPVYVKSDDVNRKSPNTMRAFRISRIRATKCWMRL